MPRKIAFVLAEIAASLPGAGNVSGLEEFFQRFSAESRDHFRIGYAFDASEFLEAEEARAVAHERGPVEFAHHAAFLGAEASFVERPFGVVLEQCAVRGDGKTVEETVEAQRLGAGGEVEDVSAFELFDAFELRVHRKSRFFASLGMARLRPTRVRRCGVFCARNVLSSAQVSRRAPRT